MVSSKMIIIKNWEERSQAEKLGFDVPAAQEIKTKVLFWKKDVMRAHINPEGNIVIATRDDDFIELEYDDKTWKEMERYFKNNEE